MGDDPPFLVVGTEVSAKYKGAFCEAKIKRLERCVKCKVTFKASGLGSIQLGDDQIKGELKVGSVVEAKYPTQNVFQQCTINKIQDCSQYTVVFDDGDIATLRRSALCLKSGRHFNESETLDQLPLTHPEHFSNPVMGGRRAAAAKRPAVSQIEDSDDEEVTTPRKTKKRKAGAPGIDLGKVVCVDSNDKKKTKDSWFPALVVSPLAQETAKIRPKDEFLVRSFKDGRFYTVPKKELTIFTKDNAKLDSSSSALRTAIESAAKYIEKDELPVHWDREALLSPERSRRTADLDLADASEPDTAVEDVGTTGDKKRFLLELQKFMEAKGTPMKKGPVVCNKELNLHKLFEAVREKGGYTKVSGSNQWKSVIQKIGFGTMPSTSTINQIKQAYKRFLHDFEEDMEKKSIAASAAASLPRARASRSKAGRKPAKQEKEEEEVEVDEKGIGSDENEAESTEETAKKIIVPPETPPRRSRSRQDVKAKPQPEIEPPEPKKSAGSEKESQPVELVIPSTDQPPTPKTARSKSKRVVKEECPPVEEPAQEKEAFTSDREHIDQSVTISLGDRLRVHYGPKSDGKLYEAKVIDIDEQKRLYLVHYTGWNTRYDEWISIFRISENLSLTQDGPLMSASQGRGPTQSSDSTMEDSQTPTRSASRGIRSKRFSPTPEQGGIRGKAASIRRKRKSEVSEDASSSDPPVTELSRADTDLGSTATSSASDVSVTKVSLEEKSPGRIQRKASRDKEIVLEVIKPAKSQHESAQAQPDVYEFEDDLAEAPKFKTISPRSPSGKKEDTSKELELENSRKSARDLISKESIVKSTGEFTSLKAQAGPAALEQETHTKVKEDVGEIQTEEPTRKGRKGFMKSQVLESSSIQTTLPATAQVSLPAPAFTPAYISGKKSSSKLADVGRGLTDSSKTDASVNLAIQNLQHDTTPVEKQKSVTEVEVYPKAVLPGTYEDAIIPKVFAAVDEPVGYERSEEPSSKRQKSVTKRGGAGGRKSSLTPKPAPTPRKGNANKRRVSPATKKQLAISAEAPSSPFLGTELLASEEKSSATEQAQKHEDVQLAAAFSPHDNSSKWSDTEFKAIELGIQAIPLTTAKEKSVLELASGESSPPPPERSVTPIVADTTSDKDADDGPKPIFAGEPDLSAVVETSRPVEVQLKIEKVEKNEATLKSFDTPAGIVTITPIAEEKEIEESCSSLLCEEEIPKSPPPNEQLAETESSAEAPGRESPVYHFRVGLPGDAEGQEEDIPTEDRPASEKSRKGLDSESATWKSKFDESQGDPIEEREHADLYDVYSPDVTKASPLGIDSTPPATPDSTNSGNVSSDFGECDDPEKEYRTSKRMKLMTKPHSDTDSICSIPGEANAEDDGSMHDTSTTAKAADRQVGYKYKAAAETGRGKREVGHAERTTRQSAPRKSEDEYGSGRRSDYRRLQEANIEDLEDTIRFTLTLPPMTIQKPPMTSKYYFIPELGDDLAAEERIAIITTSMHELKEEYASKKSFLTGIERKRKKMKKREKEKEMNAAMDQFTASVENQLSPTL